MSETQNTCVLIVEQDPNVSQTVTNILSNKKYKIKHAQTMQGATQALTETTYHLAIIGKPADGNTPFDALREVVVVSPMTSLILITNASNKEVHDLAEGYGILGHVPSTIPVSKFLNLVEKFEKLQASLGHLK